jgi:UDPglucose--hexose-1-phosphate uridylyltransferase
MAKYVPDVKTQRWVIISTVRSRRPSAAPEKKQAAFVCPFCEGNEKLTPPEVYRIGGGEKDSPGWLVRVVPNKYPITDCHEVIIHSTDDALPIEKLPQEQITRIMTAYRDRYVAHESDGQVLIFCNQGFGAGASLKHPHTQLVVVPQQINLDSVHLEPIANVVFEEGSFVAYCPDFSQWPYEVWISPKQKGGKFGDVTDGNLAQLGGALRKTLLAIDIAQSDPVQPLKKPEEPFVYNYYIYHGVNWFVRIIPRAISRAGFELGTGLNVNVVDPTIASDRLRAIIEKGVV